MRLARTQARLPLGCFSTLVMLQGCGRWAAELLKGFISRGALEIGSYFLIKGPQFRDNSRTTRGFEITFYVSGSCGVKSFSKIYGGQLSGLN